MATLEELLAPVAEDAPSGVDLAYDPERYEIERAFESSVSIDASGEASAGAEIDWREVIALIERQSGRTKDIWLPVYLARAGARSGRLDVVERGVQYLAGLLEAYWDTLHPALDEYGFQGRKGPCDALATPAEFLIPLRQVVLIEHPRLGRFTGADFERFRAGGEAEDGYGLFRAAIADLGDEGLRTAAARLEQIREAIKRADAVLTINAGSETATNFQPTYGVLDEMRRAVLAFVVAPEAVPESDAPDEAAGPEHAPAASGPRIAGRIETRDDVLRALDAVADYYRRNEPASPVPLVLRRAREWVNLDFLALLEDIAPASVDDARRILSYHRGEGEDQS